MTNKYQEALEFITDHTKADCKTIKDLEGLEFAYDILQELVDKETPMKPLYKIPDHKIRKDGEKLPHCPVCEWQLNLKYGCQNNKCRKCIDWSDEE